MIPNTTRSRRNKVAEPTYNLRTKAGRMAESRVRLLQAVWRLCLERAKGVRPAGLEPATQSHRELPYQSNTPQLQGVKGGKSHRVGPETPAETLPKCHTSYKHDVAGGAS